MFKGFSKALRLEINDMKQRKANLIFYLIVPVIIIWLYFVSASSILNLGPYASLNIRMYDVSASNIFSIIIVFMTMQLTVLRIVAERAPYGTLDRELIAISRSGMYLGKITANFLYAILQVIVIYFFGYVVFPAQNYGSFLGIFIFFLLIALFGVIFGLVISIYSKNREQAVQLVPFFILILLIFSGLFVPLEQMPAGMQAVASFMPLTIEAEAVKMLSLDGVGFEDVLGRMWGLIFINLLFFYIGLRKFKKEAKK